MATKNLSPLLALIAFLLFSPIKAFSFDITGNVIDEHSKPISYGNALILSPLDSSFLAGVVFKNGMFHLNNPNNNVVLLKITALGYHEYFQSIEVGLSGKMIDLGIIQLRPRQMAAVHIIGRRPMVEQRGTDVIVNVANTTLGSLGTAIDVLCNSPKVMLNAAGNLSVLGKGAATIYIDGQQVASPQVLQSLSSQDIKKIEIIENPSARYDAAGNAVINIITKSKSLEGYRIGVVEELEQGRYFRSYHKADVYYRLPKLLLQASYGLRPYKRRGREQYFRIIEDEHSSVEVDNKLLYNKRNLTHDLSFRGSYELHPNHKIGFQYAGTSTDGKQESENNNLFSINKTLDFHLNTKINAPFTQSNNTYSGYYQYTLDSLGSELRFSGQYADYVQQRDESIYQLLSKGVDIFPIERQSQNQNDISVKSTQIDFIKHTSKKSQLNIGTKYARIDNSSMLNFMTEQADGSLKIDPYFSNRYMYEEEITAAYAEWNVQKSSLKASFGLRSEWTRAEGVEGEGTGNQLFSRNYLDFFPSASLTKTINDNNNVSLSYNYRIQRPQFQALNPFVWYADSLVSLQGNANLRPAYSHLLDASWVHKGWTLKVNYTHTKDKINTMIRVKDLENPAVFSFVWDNIERENNYMLSLSRFVQAGKYSAYITTGARMEYHSYRDLGKLVTNQRAGYYIYANQSLTLPGKISLDAIFSYTSPRVDGIYMDRPVWFVNLGLSRKFLNNHLQVRLLANDVFDTYRFRGTTNVNDNDWTYLSEGDWHYVKLALTWDFGKLGKNSLGERKISDSELSRISKQ